MLRRDLAKKEIILDGELPLSLDPVVKRVSVSIEGVISIYRPWAPSRHLKFSTYDLRESLLPPTAFAPTGSCIADRPLLKDAVVHGVNAFLLSSKQSKSQHRSLIVRIQSMVKAIEFGWLAGRYELDDWVPRDFDNLALKLSVGGWIEALDVKARANNYLDSIDFESASAFWELTHDGDFRLNSRKLAKAIYCNIATRELHRLREFVTPRLLHLRPPGSVKSRRPKERASASVLRSDFAAINLLSDGENAPLSFRPFTQTMKLARRLSPGSDGRTKSLGPDVVASLLGGCVRWVDEIGPVVLKVFLELLELYKARHTDGRPTGLTSKEIMASCSSLRELERTTGWRVKYAVKLRGNTSDSSSTTLFAISSAVYAACFILIALFNARRKDEVEHPVLGLRTGSLALADKGLNLHTCSFYIEKTTRSHVQFYVGGLTAQAVKLLESMSNVARELRGLSCDLYAKPQDEGWDSLFVLPMLPSARHPINLARFKFYETLRETNPTAALCKDWLPLSLRPHMLRRAYALIFHYRYENATLQALGHQLQHMDLEMTNVYVTDTVGTTVADTGIALYAQISPEERNQISTDRDVLSFVLKEVGDEKLMAFVQSVLENRATFSGGYSRLVQRFHQQLGKNVSYASLDKRERVERLSEALITRGHAPLPMAHGTCMAGTNSSRLRGHCFSAMSEQLERSEARPRVCAKCPYHVVTTQHLHALKAEYEQEEADLLLLEGESVQTRRRRSDLASLGKLISLHTGRIARAPCVIDAFSDDQA